MPERTINWGGSDSPYETHVDRDGNDRVVLAEDTDGDTVLLEWDGDAEEWVYGGPVNMDGADVDEVGTLDAESVHTEEADTETLSEDYHYAGGYPGDDADERLDNALSATTGGHVVYLERAEYAADRTINNQITIIGTTPGVSPSSDDQSRINAGWTINKRVRLERVRIDSTNFEIASNGVVLTESSIRAAFSIAGDFVHVTNCGAGGETVTFESGTSDGIVDGCSRLNVTDDGNNYIGDIS